MWHLFHPAIVHFAVAFLVTGGLVEAWGLLADRERAARFGAVLVIAGTISLVPTVASGYLASSVLDAPAEAEALLEWHERTGLALIGVFLVLQVWKGWNQGRIPEGQRKLYALALLLAVALAVYGAVLGGELVYVHGVGVGCVHQHEDVMGGQVDPGPLHLDVQRASHLLELVERAHKSRLVLL